jgi:hypothetical protein
MIISIAPKRSIRFLCTEFKLEEIVIIADPVKIKALAKTCGAIGSPLNDIRKDVAFGIVIIVMIKNDRPKPNMKLVKEFTLNLFGSLINIRLSISHIIPTEIFHVITLRVKFNKSEVNHIKEQLSITTLTILTF